MPIQEPIAFHHDVFEACLTATTLAEFHVLLSKRRDRRLHELRRCWDSISQDIASYPPFLEGDLTDISPDERWGAFLHFSREFSFDALAGYFSLFTHMTEGGPDGFATTQQKGPASESSKTAAAMDNPPVHKAANADTAFSDASSMVSIYSPNELGATAPRRKRRRSEASDTSSTTIESPTENGAATAGATFSHASHTASFDGPSEYNSPTLQRKRSFASEAEVHERVLKKRRSTSTSGTTATRLPTPGPSTTNSPTLPSPSSLPVDPDYNDLSLLSLPGGPADGVCGVDEVQQDVPR